MPALIVLIVLGIVTAVILGPILAIRALAKAARLEDQLTLLRRQQLAAMTRSLSDLTQKLDGLQQALREHMKSEAAEKAGAVPLAPLVEEPPAAPPVHEVQKEEAPAPPKTKVYPAKTTPSRVGRKPPVQTPPPVRDALRKASRRETTPARERLSRISWSRFEETLGKRWLTYAGVLLLFISAAFLLRYAFVQEWINPARQIILACAVGLGMLGAGQYFLRKKMPAFGQGLIGGGLMILYAALFCAYSPIVYDQPVITSQTLTFGLMCLVTLIGVALALWNDTQPIVFLAMLGGFLTPVLTSTGTNARDALFAYVLLLDLGVVGVALWKRWRALDVLAFAGTALLFIGWFDEFYADDAAYAARALVPTMLWLGSFFAVFVALPFVQHLRRKTLVTVERFLMALGNATFMFVTAWVILHAEHPKSLAFVTVGMSACYLALGLLVQKRITEDLKAFVAFIALAVTFLTIAFPLYFELNGITLAWTAEACVLLYLGYRYAFRLLRYGAFVVLLLVIRRVVWVHWGLAVHDEAFRLILNREFMILLCAPAGAAVFAALHHVFRRDAGKPDRTIGTICTIGGGLLLLTFLNTELQQWLSFRAGGWGLDKDYLEGCSLVMLWAMGAVGFLAGGWRGRSTPLRWAGLLPVAIALYHVVALYFIRVHEPYWLLVNGRFSASLIVSALLYGYAWSVPRRTWRTAALVTAGYATLLLLHVEIYQWLTRTTMVLQWPSSHVVSRALGMLWVGGASAFIALGRRFRSRGVREGSVPAMLIAAGYAICAYAFPSAVRTPIFANTRFLLGVLVCAAVACYFYEKAAALRRWGLVASGYLVLVLLNVEIWQWLAAAAEPSVWDADYWIRTTLTALWAAGALAYLAIGRKFRSRPISRAGMPALAAAVLFAFALYVDGMASGYWIVLNRRFLASLAVTAVITAFALDEEDRNTFIAALIGTGYVLLVLVHVEIAQWIRQAAPAYGWPWLYTATCAVAISWTIGAKLTLAAALWWQRRRLYLATVPPLVVAAICLVSIYGWSIPSEHRLFLNVHFLAGFLASATAFALAWSLRRDRELLGKSERSLRTTVYWGALLLFLYVLSAEPYTWCHLSYRGEGSASWMAGMSLSIVWGTYAAGMLVAGFVLRRRATRLTALAFFAITAGKLVIVDIRWTNEIYRIISFFVLGLLMLGAGYLYHRAERLLTAADEEKREPPATPGG